MFNNMSELKMNFAAWSYPVHKDGYVYYIYLTTRQNECDRVYRFTEEEHAELRKTISGDDVHGLDHSWIWDSCEPYIITEPLQ